LSKIAEHCRQINQNQGNKQQALLETKQVSSFFFFFSFSFSFLYFSFKSTQANLCANARENPSEWACGKPLMVDS